MFKKFLKVFLVVLCSYCLLLFSRKEVLAEGEFRTDVDVSYRVQSSGITSVVNTITLENLVSDLYATSYTLVLDNIKPSSVKAYEGNINYTFKTEPNGTKTNITISFPNTVVGKGNKRVFKVSYDDPTIAQRTGEVWEITIPRLATDSTFSSYNLSFSVPLSLGEEAYMSPSPIKKQIKDGFREYFFDKNVVSKTGIVSGFGEFQVFSFNLIYHLENPLVKTVITEISLPPDTSLQKVYYSSIKPAPNNVYSDEDGNWIASYILKPRERIDITALGSVQIFATQRPFLKPSKENLNSNLLSTDYWQAGDSAILELAKKYKNPKEIYDFVVGYLSYNFDKVKPNVSRLGAIGALKDPTNAICMEFTDLFIAIARANGIPAREINGFAYTENPKIQPLSLVSDILHSWPEYWDEKRNTWVAIDPTWGNTTQGVDFFNKLDLRHFAFVIHGKNSTKPYPPGSYKLGPNPQKDVYVNFGQLPLDRTSKVEIVGKVDKFIPFTSQKIEVIVKNSGISALYNQDVQIYFDGKLNSTKNITSSLPYSNYSFLVKVPFSFLGSKTPHQVTIRVGDEALNIKGAKLEVIIYNLASIFLITLFVTLLILIKLGKIKIPNFKKIFARNPRNIQIP